MKINNAKNTPAGVKIPSYIPRIYKKRYMSRRFFTRFDNNIWAFISSFGAAPYIRTKILADIKATDKVLLIGNARGSLPTDIAGKAAEGKVEIIDPVPVQLKVLEGKTAKYPNVTLTAADAEFFKPDETERKYDVIIAFFLLGEVPDAKKSRIANNVLPLLSPNGKAIFVDYNKTAVSNLGAWLFRKVIMPVNRIIKPFAEGMMNNGTEVFIKAPERYVLRTNKYWGGIYQRTVISLK